MSEDTQQVDTAAAKRRMDAAVRAAQAATQAREAAEATERDAIAAAKARTAEYVKAVQQDAMASIGVKSRPGGGRRRRTDADAGGDGQVHGGAQVFAMNGAR